MTGNDGGEGGRRHDEMPPTSMCLLGGVFVEYRPGPIFFHDKKNQLTFRTIYDTPRQMENERTYRVENHLVYPRVGCAVMCRGLVSASHLNGVLGEMRDVKQDSIGTIRFGVHFEKIGAKSAWVKLENLRIAFELPNKD